MISADIFSQKSNLKFKHLTNKDGLSQNSGRAIIQDDRGYMWFGTEMGLDRFDGYSFLSYTHNPLDKNSLRNIYINCIAQSSKGEILIGTDGGGLNCLNVETNIFTNILHDENDKNTICGNVIFAVYEDREQNLWIGTTTGLSKYNRETKSASNFYYNENNATSLCNDVIFDIIEDKLGNIWLGTYSGLCKINKQNHKIERIPEINFFVRKLQVDNNDNLWVSSPTNGLTCYDIKNNRVNTQILDFEKIAKISNNSICDIIFENENNCWIATTDSGLIYFDKTKNLYSTIRHNPYIQHSIASDKIRSIYLDNAGVLWVGTHFNGITYYDTHSKPFNHFVADKENKHFFKSITPIMQASDGLIYMGLQTGVLIYDAERDNSTLLKHEPTQANSLSNDFITCFFEDTDGEVWIGTDEGLNLYNPNTKNITRFFPEENNSNSLGGVSVWDVKQDEDGIIWIATWGGGIASYNKKNNKFSRYQHNENNENSLSVNNTHLVYEDSKGYLWFGTWDGGLNRYDKTKNEFKIYKHKPDDINSLGHDIIMSVCEDKDGNIWIGTFGGGIDKLDIKTNKFSHFTIENGLPSNTIMGILTDQKNNLWITTAKGISKYSIVDNIFRNYDISDSVQGNEFSQHGYFKTPTSKFLLSGADGFNFFNPDSIIDSKYIPKLLITKFKVKNKEILPSDSTFLKEPIYKTKNIVLTYHENVFEFEFTAFHYANTDKIQYKYMLEGFETEWNYAENLRIAKYTNLSQGEYAFNVMSTNCDGVWCENTTSIHITILPPFWKTTWFYIASIAFLILLIFSIMRFREQKLQKAKRILEQKVKERTIEIEQQKEEITAQRDSILVQKEEILQKNEEITAQRDLVTAQKNKIEHIHHEITDSIHYAKRIQGAILPTQEFAEKILPNHFVLFKPKDIVSGDFYWMTKVENQVVVAVADCTGHGVPGAFMSMLGAAFLNDIVNKEYITQPAVILRRLRKEIIRALQQKGEVGEQKDGMDIALCAIDFDNMKLQFSGANNPLYIVKSLSSSSSNKVEENKSSDFINFTNFELYELKGDKMPIAIYERMDKFTVHEIDIQKGDCLYLFSDGYADQFGGPKGKKFMSKQLKQLLIDNYQLPMQEQKEVLENAIENWMNYEKDIYEQIDDITVMGIKI